MVRFYRFSPLLWTVADKGMVFAYVAELTTYHIPVERVKGIEVFHGRYLGDYGEIVLRELYSIYTDMNGYNEHITTSEIEIVNEEELAWLKRT